MRIAVITPYCGETIQTLQRCIGSVADQTMSADHFLIGDGREHDLKGVHHIRLPHAHRDYGDTPRLIGTLSAYALNYDGVMWLDADCWFDPTHVASMTELATREVASVVTATRMLMRPDGSQLGICHESDGRTFNDTNCYLVMRDAIPDIAPKWGFKPQRDAVIGDRFVWNAARQYRSARLTRPTVYYETMVAAHYLERGEQPPVGARHIVQNALTGFFESKPFGN